MNTFPRKTIAVASLFFSITTLALTGCQVNAEDAARERQAVNESCAASTKVFDAAGAAQPNLAITDLPAGVYRHASAEVYVDLSATDSAGRKNSARVQYLETPGRAANTFATALRCREVSGKFTGFGLMQPALVTEFTKFANGLFDYESTSYAMSFTGSTTSSFLPSFAGDQRSVSAANVAQTISSNWNGGYRFLRRTGETYELIGTRIDPSTGATVHGKAVFVRSNN